MQTADGTPEAIQKYFKEISFSGFATFLNDLNKYFRPYSNHEGMDGSGHVADGYQPPDPEDREPLLHEAYSRAMAQDTPAKGGVILGMSILTIHPYMDGNGRTSRVMFALLTNGFDGSTQDRQLFSAIGPQVPMKTVITSV